MNFIFIYENKYLEKHFKELKVTGLGEGIRGTKTDKGNSCFSGKGPVEVFDFLKVL